MTRKSVSIRNFSQEHHTKLKRLAAFHGVNVPHLLESLIDQEAKRVLPASTRKSGKPTARNK